ncbi:hypothetical protein ES703_115391 [subsurface metagenome]
MGLDGQDVCAGNQNVHPAGQAHVSERWFRSRAAALVEGWRVTEDLPGIRHSRTIKIQHEAVIIVDLG